MMYEPFQRPQQQWGMGYSYSPEPGLDGGGGGLFRPRGNTGPMPPRTGGPGQMQRPQFPMQMGGGMPPFQIPGHGMQTGGPGQMQHVAPQQFQTGGGMQQFPQQGLFQGMQDPRFANYLRGLY